MDKQKQIDLVRKRNSELSKEVESLKTKIKLDKDLNSENTKRAQDLISELEDIKKQWLEEINALRKKQDECNQLITEVRSLRNVLVDIKTGMKKRTEINTKNEIKRKNPLRKISFRRKAIQQ